MKTERIHLRVTPEEKQSITDAAVARDLTDTDYLLGLHRKSEERVAVLRNPRPIYPFALDDFKETGCVLGIAEQFHVISEVNKVQQSVFNSILQPIILGAPKPINGVIVWAPEPEDTERQSCQQ